MIAMACTLVFTAAAVTALATIAGTLRMYRSDVMALRAQFRRGVPDLFVSWRIRETGAYAAGSAAQAFAEIRASHPKAQPRTAYSVRQQGLAA